MYLHSIAYDFYIEQTIMGCFEHVCSRNEAVSHPIPNRHGNGEEDLPLNRGRGGVRGVGMGTERGVPDPKPSHFVPNYYTILFLND